MFDVKIKSTGEIVSVYSVKDDTFLVFCDNRFQYISSDEFCPADENCGVSQCLSAKLTAPAIFSGDVETVLDEVCSGKVKAGIGTTISTKLLNGIAVDFVVTDFDDSTIRFESRDCIGTYVPMTKIDDYYKTVWDTMPDVLKARIVETERQHLSTKGKIVSFRQKLFLPAASEIFNSDMCYGDRDLYEQMEYYKDVHNRIRALSKGGKADWYWTESHYSGNTTYWCIVTNNGYAHYSSASSTRVAAPVCFRVRRS